MIVDLFCGGGGASAGIKLAGFDVDVAVDYLPFAIKAHKANHPNTKHYCEDVRSVNTKEATEGKPVDLLWASPPCTNFSRAKSDKPRDEESRSMAYVVVDWAREVHPRVIILENVPEFLTWGPLGPDSRPCPKRKGEDFRAWIAQLVWLGYEVEWRTLVAADYGAPTTRKRLFLIARRDGLPIVWPEPTHGPGRAKPWRTDAEIIDWSVPTRSIFGRKKPLADATLARIVRGLKRFVLQAAKPFVVSYYGTGGPLSLQDPLDTVTTPLDTVTTRVAPTLIQTGYGERKGQAPRVLDLHKPLGAVVAGGAKHGLVTAWITKHYGGVTGHGMGRPIGAVTTQDHHALTTASLYPAGVDRRAEVRELVGGEALATIDGESYEVSDVGMRMLTPRELFRAQGFPDNYDTTGLNQTQQTFIAGNSVSPLVAQALVSANLGGAE